MPGARLALTTGVVGVTTTFFSELVVVVVDLLVLPLLPAGLLLFDLVEVQPVIVKNMQMKIVQILINLHISLFM
jgi:hypothetical protein